MFTFISQLELIKYFYVQSRDFSKVLVQCVKSTKVSVFRYGISQARPAESSVERCLVSLPVSHVADKCFAVPVSAAEPGGRQKNPAISPVRVARLFLSSLVPATDGSPSFELTLPVVGHLPDFISLGARVASRLLCENSFAGKLVTVLVTCCSSLQMAGAVSDIIDIPDAETLSKIGHDRSFTLDGHYRQTGDINARYLEPLGSAKWPFTGSFDGNGQYIDHVSGCLFGQLGGDSTVSNLHIRNASITLGKEQDLGVIACTMTENSRISQALVVNSSIVIDSGVVSASQEPFDINVAIGSARMNGNARIDHLNVVNSSIITSGDVVIVGAGAGTMEGNAILDQLRAMSFSIFTNDKISYAGIGAGRAMGDTLVNGTTGINCLLYSLSDTVYGATGVGSATDNALIENTLSVSNFFQANSFSLHKWMPLPYCPSSYLAVGAGVSTGQAQVLNTTAIENRIYAKTQSECGDACVGIGIGQAGELSYAKNTEAVSCHLEALESGWKDVSRRVVPASERASEGSIAFGNILDCTKIKKVTGGKAAIDGVVQLDRCVAKLAGGISCVNMRHGTGKAHYFPDSPECGDICWSTVSNVSSDATGIHFDRSCRYLTPDDLGRLDPLLIGTSLLSLAFWLWLGLYIDYRQGRPDGGSLPVVDRLFRTCEWYLGIPPPPVHRRGPDLHRRGAVRG